MKINIDVEATNFDDFRIGTNAGQKNNSPPKLQYPSHKHNKMLYLIGLGLSDETDITVKGLSVVRAASRVYLEAYTSILLVEKSILVSILFLAPMQIWRADADGQ